MTLSILFDGLLAVLLATTIVYAALLNRKLKQLRQGEAEMKGLLVAFDASAAKAEANLGRMKALAGETPAARGPGAGDLAALRQQTERGQVLKDDLAFLIDRGEAIADRLIGAVSEAREASRPVAPVNLAAVPLATPPAAAAPAKPRKAGTASVAERELIRALRAARPER